jgi:hypothetical protein
MRSPQSTSKAIQSLPRGWRLEIVDRGTQDRWLVVHGPEGQEAAFGCERGEYASPRSKVLDQFMEAAS